MRLLAVLGLSLLSLSGCGGSRPDPQVAHGPGVYKLGQPYQINGRWYRPYYDPAYRADGLASWYGVPFHGRRTANGEVFDKNLLTAAHPTLPLPSLVRVTNLENGRELVLRVNDRGPFVDDRVIDVSRRAARDLGFERQGLAQVRVEFLGLADGRGTPPEPTVRTAVAAAPPPEPVVRTAATEAPSPSPPRACPAAEGAFIQVAAFTEPQRAEALALRLRGWHPTRVVTHRANDLALARVQLGPIADAERVQQVLDGVRGMGFSNAFLVAPEGNGAPSGSPPSVPC